MKFRLAVLIGVVAALAGYGCGKAQGSKVPMNGPKEAAPVRIGVVEQRQLPVQLSNFGRVEAYTTISVRAQVGGELTKVCFNEGDVVEKDQVLFIIDPRPYEVALKQAEANLAMAQAQLEQARAMLAKDKMQADNAERESKRSETLLPQKMVSQEEYDRARTNAAALGEAVAGDEASVKSAMEAIRATEVAIDDAKLRLDYCTIRSPIRGRTGSVQIHQGNLVKANDTTPMVVINQTEPIYVSFTLTEKYLSEVRKQMEGGPLEVTATIPKEEDRPVTGKLVFVDNTVDQDTGTVRFKAVFDNTDNRLWPGQYVNPVAVRISVLLNAIAAPAAAVQTGQSGAYVYVVKPDMTAELRNVVPGDTMDGMTVIKEGLQPEEKVVTDGQLRVMPGALVKVVSDANAQGDKK